jgi:hypothetical protein
MAYVLEINSNLIYEVAVDVRFGQELANREFCIMRFAHSVMATISLMMWQMFFYEYAPKIVFFLF